ncbi:MAG: hypothetical protein Q7U10_00055 [Thermodesulfovibrionia bacterium]|nr:hypothetical protein [Thermodesulfovibrionia bacterium]
MLFSTAEYKSMREEYCYYDRDCRFEIVATTFLDSSFIGTYEGIFPKTVPPRYTHGINLRRFEIIIQKIFADADHAESNNTLTPSHGANLKGIACAVVHWKMASQGGRANLMAKNVKDKWKDKTVKTIINAYRKRDLQLFEIEGVRIPTATAFLRFLFPDEYGIMDSRVAKITQQRNITQLDLRDDGYIKDIKKNKEQYNNKYNPFLVAEASKLNDYGILFQDIDEHGNTINSKFRPCDIEMALF